MRKANANNPNSITADRSLLTYVKGNTEIKHNEVERAVIYTRVSDVVQLNNTSLATQLQYCSELAAKHNWEVVATFGGTYESAKDDEREEFKKMVAFVKKKAIKHIIVYSADRFSRSGINAILEASKLRGEGIHISSVLQDFDTSTTSGEFMQNMMFLFAHQDNMQRKEKSIVGQKARLLSGKWCMRAPIGYKNITEGGERKVVPHEKYAPLVKLAFKWKTEEIISDVEIRKRLIAAGWETRKIGIASVQRIFKNVFYCGYITSNLIPGKLVKGLHEPLISEDVFLAISEKKKVVPKGFKWNREQVQISLKQFAKCGFCGKPLSGFLNKTKNLHYYNCYTKGCQRSASAHKLNTAFEEILSLIQIHPNLAAPLTDILTSRVQHHQTTEKENTAQLNRQKKEIENKLALIEERYVLAEITKEQYSTFFQKYNAEKKELEQILAESNLTTSNHKKHIEKYVHLAQNIASLWRSGSFVTRTALQKFIFPDGITFNKTNGEILTEKMNGVFQCIADFKGVSEGMQQGFPVGENKYFRYQMAIKIGLTIVPG